MRRPVAALTVALVAALLASSLLGCGGGEEETAVQAPPAEEAAPPPPSAETEIADRSAPESATVFEPFPRGSYIPAAVAERVEAGDPTLILFVDGSQKVTNEVRSAVDEALDEYDGVVGLVLFDLAKYTSVDSSGVAVVDAEKLTKDEATSGAVSLAQSLGVSTLPYIVMTDDQGYLVFRHRGLVDAGYLAMHMERLTQ